MLKKTLPGENLKLILAGGYEPHNAEHVAHFRELTQLSRRLCPEGDVALLKSPSEEEKRDLFHSSAALLYTPRAEHFGILPLEAMACGLPVVAVAAGGPMETVADGRSGYLKEASAADFCEAMMELLEGGLEMRRAMGEEGKKRVQQQFSFRAFQEEINRAVCFK